MRRRIFPIWKSLQKDASADRWDASADLERRRRMFSTSQAKRKDATADVLDAQSYGEMRRRVFHTRKSVCATQTTA
jgi:hypothetical protein